MLDYQTMTNTAKKTELKTMSQTQANQKFHSAQTATRCGKFGLQNRAECLALVTDPARSGKSKTQDCADFLAAPLGG